MLKFHSQKCNLLKHGMEETWKKSLEKQVLFDDSDVPDWLLTEILQRLPLKHIFMFKCISKRWLALISDPFFARLYITRINNTLSLSASQPWNLLFRYLYEVRIVPSSMIGTRIALKQSHDFSCPGFSLNFVPSSKNDCPIKILASSNGLLLCSESFYWQKIYYICNPLIQQCIALPKPPRVIKSVAIGFICKDDCYKLVRFPTADDGSYSLYSVQLETFSSKTGEWHCSMVDCPLSDYYIKTDSLVVNYNGRLHWLEFRHSKIVTYNPETDGRLDLMNLPENKQSEHLCLLGVTHGRFRYFEVTDTCLGPREVCVWVVSDYAAQHWCLEYRVKFSDSWSGEHDLFVPKDKFYVFPLALHPLDFGVVYLGYGGCLVSYNLTTRKMEVVHRNFYSHQLLPFVLSPWPTTIPPPFW